MRHDGDEWGHSLPQRRDELSWRVIYQNIGPQRALASSLHARQTAHAIHKMKADVFMFGEHGLNLGKLPPAHSWDSRIKPFFTATFSVLAHNCKEEQHYADSQFRTGGTGITITESVVDRKMSQGRDPTGLGRWTWIAIQGRQEFKTVFLSAYRPVKNAKDQGSVWRQHERYLLSENDNRDPLTAFDLDLTAQLRHFIDSHYQIVIALDCNEDIRDGQISKMMMELGLIELILTQHGSTNPPATHNRNTQGTPIDGIWATRNLAPLRSGYLGFDEGCPSDHRALWVEIPIACILGHRPNLPPKRIAHRLRVDHPTEVRKYNRKVNRLLQQEGVLKDITHLRALAVQCRTDNTQNHRQTLETELNKVLVNIHRIRSQVEKSIRKTPTGEVAWSPTLQKCVQRIDLWTRSLKQASGRTTSRTVLRRLAHRYHAPEALYASIRYAEKQLDEAYAAYKRTKKQAQTLREEHLEKLAAQRALTKGTTTASQLKIMRTHERQRRLGKASKRLRGSQPKKSILSVTYTAPDGSEEVAVVESDIVLACSRSNQARQRKCISTCPFLQEPVLSQIGLSADGPGADQILQGTWEIPNSMDPYAADFIRHLHRPPALAALPEIKIGLTVKDHQQAWLRQKSATGSEPSTLSFAHFIAASHDATLSKVDVLNRNLSMEFGLAPDHLCRITDVEIMKKANIFHVDKMRLIQLMPAEFNINNKWMGRLAMQRAEATGLLPPDQYGSRKGHRAIAALLNKRVTSDLLRQHKQSGAFCLVDAEGCYDRVSHPVAGLVLRFFGVPRLAVRHAYRVLQKAQHCIATGFGVSEPVYGGSLDGDDVPIQGLGQGNGKGPAVWALISAILITMLYSAGKGVRLVSAILGRVIQFAVFAFVDDTDLVITGKQPDTPGEEILQDLQSMVRRWEGGLRATGGALVPSKSCFYLIDFEWKNRSWKYRQQDSMPGNIRLRDPTTGMWTNISRMEAKQATKTLGVFLAMDGSDNEQFSHLLDLARSFAESIRTNHSSKAEAWFCLTRSFYKTLEYPMLVTTLNQKQWETVMQPVLKVILPRLGLARTFPRVVVYSPRQSQGIQLYHPWFLQESIHITGLANEIANNTLTGSLIQGSLEALTVEHGDSPILGAAPFEALQGCAVSSWAKSLWETTDRFQIKIQTLPASANQLLRANDCYLMRSFWSQGFRGSSLRMLNECRMAIGAVSLADVTTIDGSALSTLALSGRSGNGLRQYQWPRRPPLSATDWSLWKEALQSTFAHPNGLRRRLRHPLGAWVSDAPMPQWKWWLNPDTNSLYQHTPNGWEEFSTRGRVQRTRTRRYCSTGSVQPGLPHESPLLPVSVSLSGSTFSIECTGPEWHPPRCHQSTIHSLLQAEDILCDVALLPTDNCHSLAESIRQRTARAACDGSFKTGFATAAAIITSGATTTFQAQLLSAIPGVEEEQTSFRAEVGGILMVLYFVETLVSSFTIDTGQITIALDNEAAVTTASSPFQVLHIGSPCFDLWQSVFSILKQLPIDVVFHWVKGHQDTSRRRPLDWWARQNIRVDHAAKAYWSLCHSRGAVSTPRTLRYEKVTISLQGLKRGHLRLPTLYTHLYEPTSHAYWQQRGHFDTGHPSSVQWDAIRDLYTGYSIGFQIFAIKFATDLLPTAKTMYRRNAASSSQCPRCQHHQEDCFHLLQCKDAAATTVWNKQLQGLRKVLQKLDTDPVLMHSIVSNLARWRASRIPRSTIPPAHHQAQLGWDNFIRGRIHVSWQQAQHRYYSHTRSRRSSRRWTVALINHLQATAWDLWDHRNRVLHGPTGTQAQAEREQREAALRQEYSAGLRAILPQHAHLFSLTASDLFALDPQSQRQWLRSVALARSYRPEPDLGTELPSQWREQQFMQRWLAH